MLTLFNCLSTTDVKKAIVFYYNVHVILYTLLIACHVCMWPCFVHFCYAKVALPELLEGPHQPVLKFPKESFGQKNLCNTAFRASDIAAKSRP